MHGMNDVDDNGGEAVDDEGLVALAAVCFDFLNRKFIEKGKKNTCRSSTYIHISDEVCKKYGAPPHR